MTELELLFDEFAARHARGDRPDARDYLERAGDQREELARMLDGFLAAAPVQPPSEETRALFASLVPEMSAHPEMPPLLAERVRRGWTRKEIVTWISERFAIGEEKEDKVADYWHELETGLLPVIRVSERLREALRERFGEAVQAAAGWQPPGVDAQVAYRRKDASFELPSTLLQARLDVPPPPARDEVDELFRAHP